MDGFEGLNLAKGVDIVSEVPPEFVREMQRNWAKGVDVMLGVPPDSVG